MSEGAHIVVKGRNVGFCGSDESIGCFSIRCHPNDFAVAEDILLSIDQGLKVAPIARYKD